MIVELETTLLSCLSPCVIFLKMFDFIVSIDQLAERVILLWNNFYLLKFFHSITEFGSAVFAVILFFCIVYFLWRRKSRLLKSFVVAFVCNEALVYILKILIGRSRPPGAFMYGEYDSSMPSGHAAVSIFLYGSICYLIYKLYPAGYKRNAIMVSLVALVILIGFSRLYMDVHYLSDVLAGFMLGGATLYCLIRLNIVY